MSILAISTMVAETAAHAEGGGSSAGLPQLDPTWWPSQLFWLTLTFGILYWLMAGKFLPAIGAAIEQRRDRIADDLDQAAELRRQSEEAEAAYEKALADARAKAQAIAAETRAEVDARITTMQAETDATIDKQIAAAEARFAGMKSEAAAKVREAAAETARAIVEALIDETPTPEAVSKAIVTVTSPVSTRAA